MAAKQRGTKPVLNHWQNNSKEWEISCDSQHIIGTASESICKWSHNIPLSSAPSPHPSNRRSWPPGYSGQSIRLVISLLYHKEATGVEVFRLQMVWGLNYLELFVITIYSIHQQVANEEVLQSHT